MKSLSEQFQELINFANEGNYEEIKKSLSLKDNLFFQKYSPELLVILKESICKNHNDIFFYLQPKLNITSNDTINLLLLAAGHSNTDVTIHFLNKMLPKQVGKIAIYLMDKIISTDNEDIAKYILETPKIKKEVEKNIILSFQRFIDIQLENINNAHTYYYVSPVNVSNKENFVIPENKTLQYLYNNLEIDLDVLNVDNKDMYQQYIKKLKSTKQHNKLINSLSEKGKINKVKNKI